MRAAARAFARGRGTAVVLLVVAGTACGSARAGSDGATPTNVRYGVPAKDFSLVDQFGHPEQLSDFRGRVVLLTFIDARCTELCPLTADLLRRAKESLGGDPPVQLLAIDANPNATAVADVRRWSRRHRMLHQWLFLTAPVHRLARVWASYGIRVTVDKDEVAHSSVIYVIDVSGRRRAIFPIATRSGIPDEVDALDDAVRRVS
jgi:cytochrome oxidase Cu insertion factor (SCO1/SenC/PrrC family)